MLIYLSRGENTMSFSLRGKGQSSTMISRRRFLQAGGVGALGQGRMIRFRLGQVRFSQSHLSRPLVRHHVRYLGSYDALGCDAPREP